MLNKLTDELAVCGYKACAALAEYHPEKINRLFLRKELMPDFTALCKSLAERKRPYKFCEDEELERLCKSTHHQGIVAMVYKPEIEPAQEEDIAAWAEGGRTCLLLCNIGNDHNLGAIVRAAAFFEATEIILTEKEGEGELLTTSAYRVAEGGMEQANFRRIRNPAAFLRDASKSLLTIGTAPRARIRIGDLHKLIKEKEASMGRRAGVVLVVGNEEQGLPKSVLDACGIIARIPGTGFVESLNVSQAAALFLRELYER
jgi:TrmH RNA methyltransferase